MMHDLTPQDYQRIIATLNAQKAAAELAALEWQVRAENATAAFASQTTTEEATS
ncbi:hypothetical protein [Kocuria rhizophila]|uniref:hypothetical protein n=1 Tax=Kocuria rhizophila TaxID=72000 RepID=UPI00190ABC8E|nr:hypothetical protein [Kocuria rhizophila]MBK4119735.1 hypothetical protein [Kocuria rhizophila]